MKINHEFWKCELQLISIVDVPKIQYLIDLKIQMIKIYTVPNEEVYSC